MTLGTPWRTSLAAGFLAGLSGGELFLAAGLLRSGGDLFLTTPSRALAVWVVVRSVGLYGLLFAAGGLVLAIVLRGMARRLPVFATISAAVVSLTVFSTLTAWWQLGVVSWLPLGSPERWATALGHMGVALAAGGLVFAVLRRLARRQPGLLGRTPRLAAAGLAGAVVCLVAGEVAFFRPAADDPGRPWQVIVLGLDAMTFRVLSPMLRAGELPAFRRLLDEGAWGTFPTYGTASSPLVWTTMATGKKVRDHGIDDFVVADAGYGTRPIKSYDRKSRALWNVLGLFGRRVAVVNWLVTYPPEEVDGVVAARLEEGTPDGFYPPELYDELEPLLDATAPADGSLESKVTSSVDRVFGVVRHLLAKEHLDLLVTHEHSADTAQHLTWRSYQPEAFDPALWPPVPGDGPPLVAEVYRRLDRQLSELLDTLPEDTLLIVVSDHGQRPRPHPRIRLEIDRILLRLGYARLRDGSPERLDYARSELYTLEGTPTAPTYRINVNLRGREPSGIVDPGDAAALVERAKADLLALELAGEPLFEDVTGAVTQGFSGDLLIVPSAAVVRRLSRDPEARRETVAVGGEAVPMAELLTVATSLSGVHERQGVLFLHGPGVRPGPIGQRAVETPIQEVVWALTDKVDAVDDVLGVLRFLGLVERATTLDLAPTVLYALGLPVARDMAGSPRTEFFSNPPAVQWIDSYEGRDDVASPDDDAESDAEVLERLRSLGYIH